MITVSQTHGIIFTIFFHIGLKHSFKEYEIHLFENEHIVHKEFANDHKCFGEIIKEFGKKKYYVFK